MVIPVGFEPTAACLEGRCSIQLSYGINAAKVLKKSNLRMSRRDGRCSIQLSYGINAAKVIRKSNLRLSRRDGGMLYPAELRYQCCKGA